MENEKRMKRLPGIEDSEREEGQFSQSSADTGKDHSCKHSDRNVHNTLTLTLSEWIEAG